MGEQEQYNEIGALVAYQAYLIFEACGRAKDYCIQGVGEVAVFGGWNRLLFSPRRGWYLDESYCGAEFIAAFEEWKRGVAYGG